MNRPNSNIVDSRIYRQIAHGPHGDSSVGIKLVNQRICRIRLGNDLIERKQVFGLNGFQTNGATKLNALIQANRLVDRFSDLFREDFALFR